ncbi:MAG TPA: sulfatase [Phycisphaerae bacterium]|nr:sulfatase [Phycisphaerae bacterium]
MMGHATKHPPRRCFVRPAVTASLICGALCGCARDEPQSEPDTRPNFLWIVWDTVRADHLSLYGHTNPTTPFLEQWAGDARVFDNCLSVSSTTAPSHASMFTGLMPTEHTTDNTRAYLPSDANTLAERLHAGGYQTYLFSANPYISPAHNFTQGFDLAEHPWSPKYEQDALRIVRQKVPAHDRSSELPQKLAAGQLSVWTIKACGQLTLTGVESWLATRDQQRPYFVFLNYMEAHRPYIPPEKYRRRMMTPQQVTRSYQIDRGWLPIWEYTFGLREYSRADLEVVAATYDAAIAELDDLLKDLLTSLQAKGLLDNTVVILTSDHGEHLGEKHMLDHQFSLYQPLLRVPLVIHYPPRFQPGRDRRPVMNHDLFPTLLTLAGIDPPPGSSTQPVSLLAPLDTRNRIAEYPSPMARPIDTVLQAHRNWDPSPWQRSLRSITDDRFKYIWASDGRHELYDLRIDPQERGNIIHLETEATQRLADTLDSAVKAYHQPDFAPAPTGTLSEQERQRLGAMGYLDEQPDQTSPEEVPTSRPTPP